MAFFEKNKNNINIPLHIAIIMDGNGRWAKSRGLSRTVGHKAGAETLKKIAEECQKLEIKHLTVYAFSTENWNRPKDEINTLMNLLREYIQKYIEEADTNNIKVDIIGDISGLDVDIQDKIKILYEKTKNKTGLNFHMAINYGGRDEIIRAMRKMYKDLLYNNLNANSISQEMFEKYLDTAGTPMPELVIRTSGEERISNFLLWQTAYSELYFSKKLWPDFNIDELHKALKDYQNRNRRFGGI